MAFEMGSAEWVLIVDASGFQKTGPDAAQIRSRISTTSFQACDRRSARRPRIAAVRAARERRAG